MSCGTLLQVLGLMRVMWNVVAGTGTNACNVGRCCRYWD